MSHWSSGLPVCFPSQGTQVQIPRGVLMWKRDFPVSDVSLHWWPRRDWSLWPRLRQALSRTVTRPLSRQCDNPTWSHTAFLSRFHARCRSPFRLHNRRSRLLRGSPVESLQSHFILTMSHWSSGLPVCFPSQGTQVQISRGVLMWNWDSPVSNVSLHLKNFAHRRIFNSGKMFNFTEASVLRMKSSVGKDLHYVDVMVQYIQQFEVGPGGYIMYSTTGATSSLRRMAGGLCRDIVNTKFTRVRH
jgi:hypothetical protein